MYSPPIFHPQKKPWSWSLLDCIGAPTWHSYWVAGAGQLAGRLAAMADCLAGEDCPLYTLIPARKLYYMVKLTPWWTVEFCLGILHFCVCNNCLNKIKHSLLMSPLNSADLISYYICKQDKQALTIVSLSSPLSIRKDIACCMACFLFQTHLEL